MNAEGSLGVSATPGVGATAPAIPVRSVLALGRGTVLAAPTIVVWIANRRTLHTMSPLQWSNEDGSSDRSASQGCESTCWHGWYRPGDPRPSRPIANDLPPPSLVDLVPRIAPRPALLIWAPNDGNRETMNTMYQDLIGTSADLWEMRDARHIKGLQARPEEYERRVVGFFSRAFAAAEPAVHE
jgi:hypothetical protein